jgi:phosphoglycerate dehydrogenase-like enzyme
MPKSTPAKAQKFHLHIENGHKRQWIFKLTDEIFAAAAKRHSALARRLTVTNGWDGDIIGQALPTADFMISNSPPRERLREHAPRLKWIQTTGAGIDSLLPLDWLPADIKLTNNSGAHGDKAEDSCTMALLMLQTRMAEIFANQHAKTWTRYSPPRSPARRRSSSASAISAARRDGRRKNSVSKS